MARLVVLFIFGFLLGCGTFGPHLTAAQEHDEEDPVVEMARNPPAPEEDELIEDEDDDDDDGGAKVEDEYEREATDEIVREKMEEAERERAEREAEETAKIGPHDNVEVRAHFLEPVDPHGLAPGKPAQLLIALSNRAPDTELLVDTAEASLRYPADFSYHIQNFTHISYKKEVKSGQDATFLYGFVPHEFFHGRPFGLTIELLYRDGQSESYVHTVFNDTVNILEPDEGFDTEQLFMWLVLLAMLALLLVGLYQLLVKRRGGKGGSIRSAAFNVFKKADRLKLEHGTQQNKHNVDYDWLPAGLLKQTGSPGKKSPANKSPANKSAANKSPRSNKSPRQANGRKKAAQA